MVQNAVVYRDVGRGTGLCSAGCGGERVGSNRACVDHAESGEVGDAVDEVGRLVEHVVAS